MKLKERIYGINDNDSLTQLVEYCTLTDKKSIWARNPHFEEG